MDLIGPLALGLPRDNCTSIAIEYQLIVLSLKPATYHAIWLGSSYSIYCKRVPSHCGNVV